MQNLSYAALHDKLLKQYQRYVLYLCWSGVLAIFSLILYAIGIYSDNNIVGLGGTYNIPTFIALLIWDKIPEPLAIFLIFLFNALFGVILGFLGIKARKGKTIYLYSALGIYLADSIGLLLALLVPKLPSQDIVLSLIVHFVVLAIIFLAFYKRKQIIVLAEKQRKKMVFEDDPNGSKKVLSYKKAKRTLDNKEVLADEISSSEDKIEKKEE